MHIRELQGKAVCVLGYGREGRATLAALKEHAPGARITIADRDPTVQAEGPYPLQTGEEWLRGLSAFDVVIKSPGIPPLPELEAVRGKLTNATQIFLDTVRSAGATVVGVTGSKGKSTTASLIAAVLQAGGKDCHLVGNIGVPALSHLDRANEGTIFVMEMSSYQLMDLTVSPEIAVVTSFFPEHLDYHGSLANYMEAKKHITKFQAQGDYVFYDASSPGAAEIAEAGRAIRVGCREEDSASRIDETQLIGRHNLRNCALASMVAEHFRVERQTVRTALRRFRGLPHRLQSLGIHHSIEWVDDAISTTPESAAQALEALGDRVGTIILGGQDRGIEFQLLGEAVARSAVNTVILLPDTGGKIRRSIEAAGAKGIAFYEARDMQEVVEIAKKHTPKGRICLLSTASPSYNMFKNFEEKGEEFAKAALRE